MTNEASPRPWRVVYDIDGNDNNQIVDANGKDVVSFYDWEGNLSKDNADLIVDAVNERESLFADMKVKETEMRLKIDAAEKERTEAHIMRDRAKEWHSVWLKENDKLRDKLDASEAERDRLREALQEIIRKVGGENYADDDGVDPVDILEIARAAIGEDEK